MSRYCQPAVLWFAVPLPGEELSSELTQQGCQSLNGHMQQPQRKTLPPMLWAI
jgi:hypothetical protein